MKSPQFYGGQPVWNIAEAELALISAEGGYNPVRVDLQAAPWKDAAAILLAAKIVSNADGNGKTIYLQCAFSTEELAPAVAATQLYTRRITTNLLLSTAEAELITREYVSARIPIQGRYLYLWHSASAGDGSFALTLHAIPVD